MTTPAHFRPFFAIILLWSHSFGTRQKAPFQSGIPQLPTDCYTSVMANPDDTDFQLLAEYSVDIICRVGMDSIIRYASPSCLQLLGWTPEEMIGVGPDDIVFPEDLHIITAARELMASGVRDSPATVRVRRKNGGVIWMEINARLVRDSVTGAPNEVVLVMRDITDRKLLEEKLSALALTDGLTGLGNRRAFDEALEKEWKRTLREGSQMSLLLLDVDYFKQFNDRYGHQFGDDCLRAVATVVGDTVHRAIDFVARYGGEEIAIILPCTDTAGALQVAEKVRRAIAGLRIPYPENREAGELVTASIGVATALARHGGTMKMPESLLLSADYALYHAKHDGRNRVATTVLMAARDIEADAPSALRLDAELIANKT